MIVASPQSAPARARSAQASPADNPDPVALLNAWLAVEALQPQTFATQEDLLGREPPAKRKGQRDAPLPRALFPFDLAGGQMPWDGPEGDRRRLAMSEDDRLVWYVPLGFVKMEPAVERLVTEVQPEGPERERGSGVAVLALAAFDEAGRALPSSLLLSSFGWACGRVLAGDIDRLHAFVDLEGELRHQLGQALVQLDLDARKVATSRQRFLEGMAAIMAALELPADLLERPRVAIRVVGEADGDPVDIINSFYLRDLHRVRTALDAGAGGATLAAYLGQARPARQVDVLADKAVLESLVAPARTPGARWPAPSPAKLVTLQQAAVNATVRDLADGGLLSINGPPGTGKTTLLRDVIAAVLEARADALVALDDPTSAFSPVELVAEGGHRRVLYRPPAALAGRGVVVASSNNAAVRNVSAELPLAGAVDDPAAVRYFPDTARVAQGGDADCWGLIAAVLGNRKNRSEFVESVWWDPDWGLEKYLAAVNGRPEVEPPAIVAAEAPPRTRGEARERWRRAQMDYRERKSAVARLLAGREQMRLALADAAAVQQALEDALAAEAAAQADGQAASETREAAALALARAETALADARRLHDGGAALRPGWVARLVGQDAVWRQSQARTLAVLEQAMADQAAARAEQDAADRRARDATARLTLAQAAQAVAMARREALLRLEAEGRGLYGDQVGPGFWESGHAAIHTASPWADSALIEARDQLFAAAMALHRAFLDAAARPMKSNLALMMDHLKGKRLPSGAAAHLDALWDSFFLVVPVVSTTFASFDRLMDGLGEASVGWLIVDEAGQATPQAAAGALWRARRALVIGDPLQIEPVSTVPAGLVRSIFSSRGAHPDVWAAPRASVQTLADAASPLTAAVGWGADARRIGMPLLVHRRCQEPMFSISNTIAYDGLMVHATSASPSPIRQALIEIAPGSCWLDVASSSAKWSPREGQVVLDLLRRLAEQGVRDPDLYLIAPFREVADTLRSLVVRSGVLDQLGVPAKQHRRWGETRIGTVHTFQGKEAEAVILVLGASADASRGSRSWAGGAPNILNVAVTRAKKALYIVGRHEAWRTAGVFAHAAAVLPVVSLEP
jgi:hypothetical protein